MFNPFIHNFQYLASTSSLKRSPNPVPVFPNSCHLSSRYHPCKSFAHFPQYFNIIFYYLKANSIAGKEN